MIKALSSCALACAAQFFNGHALAQSAKVDPQADSILRAATTYLAGLKSFSVRTENTLEVVTTDGQKIQFSSPASVVIVRPNKLFAERNGDIVNQAFYYDGKTLTLYSPEGKFYATVPAPATLDETLDFARDDLDVFAPGADLIDTRAYSRLTQDVISGQYLGIAVVNGQRCHHLAYRATEVDWQLWVREGDKPIPCRYVITSKRITGAPQYSLQIREWDNSPKDLQGKFDFVAPAGAKAIKFLPVTTP